MTTTTLTLLAVSLVEARDSLWSLVIQPALAVLGSALALWLAARLNVRMDDGRRAELSRQVGNAAHAVVAHVYQTFVKGARRDRSFDASAQEAAADRAAAMVRTMLPTVLSGLRGLGVDTERLIRVAIEEAVVDFKRSHQPERMHFDDEEDTGKDDPEPEGDKVIEPEAKKGSQPD